MEYDKIRDRDPIGRSRTRPFLPLSLDATKDKFRRHKTFPMQKRTRSRLKFEWRLKSLQIIIIITIAEANPHQFEFVICRWKNKPSQTKSNQVQNWTVTQVHNFESPKSRPLEFGPLGLASYQLPTYVLCSYGLRIPPFVTTYQLPPQITIICSSYIHHTHIIIDYYHTAYLLRTLTLLAVRCTVHQYYSYQN